MSNRRSIADFPRNEAGLVDAFIGTAYDTVKSVSDNLEEIQRLDGVLEEIPGMAHDTVTAEVAAAMVPVQAKIDEAVDTTNNSVIEAGNIVSTGQAAIDQQVVDAGVIIDSKVVVAQDAAAEAKAARDAAMVGAKIYATTAAGLAATTSGQYFSVPVGNATGFLTLYLNSSGTAVPQGTYPSKEAVDAVANKLKSSSQSTPSRLPIAVTQAGQVAIWLEDGDFGARDLTPALRAKVIRDVVTSFQGTPDYFPLMRTESGQVPMWWQHDGLNIAHLSKNLISKILGGDDRIIPPAVSGPTTVAPVFTDGRNNHNWRAGAARVQMASVGSKAKIGVVGDSWAQNPHIARAIRTYLATKGAMSGEETWRPAITTETYFQSTVAYTGWTLVDGSVATVFPYGAGVDGHNIYSTNTTATLALGNATATRIRIYHSKVPGAWRYRVDGGVWNNVVNNGGVQELGIVDITGLSNTAHLVEIDTTNNTGVAAIHGFSLTNNAGGYEVVKMGNGGLTGKMMKNFIPYMAPIATDFQINMLVVILGTNDYRIASATPEEFIDALTQLTAAWRSINPTMGFVFVIPPQSDGVTVVPLATYRDAMYDFALANNCEFLNILDVFGTYAETAALGQWADSLHLNDSGATNLAAQFTRAFL